MDGSEDGAVEGWSDGKSFIIGALGLASGVREMRLERGDRVAVTGDRIISFMIMPIIMTGDV